MKFNDYLMSIWWSFAKVMKIVFYILLIGGGFGLLICGLAFVMNVAGPLVAIGIVIGLALTAFIYFEYRDFKDWIERRYKAAETHSREAEEYELMAENADFNDLDEEEIQRLKNYYRSCANVARENAKQCYESIAKAKKTGKRTWC